ncbi:MAG: RluA family pseudouridine synthase [Mycoplasmatota bacterium]
MIVIFKVEEEKELMQYLLSKEMGRKNIKNMLKYSNVLVNNKVVKAYNYLLKKGDVVTFKNTKEDVRDKQSNLKIIFEDKNILVLDKPAGLLTVSTDKEKEKTLFHIASEYVKKGNYKNKIFIINRLDKGTSGVVMFAKTEKIKEAYQSNWNDLVIKRSYIAIVEGILEKKEQTICKKLIEVNDRVKVSNDGKSAITSYKVRKEKDNYSLLDVEIKTGRKNQIRVHLSSIGHGIIGDEKYGSKKSPIKRMGLHANLLEIKNPITKETFEFSSKIPSNFKYLFKGEK